MKHKSDKAHETILILQDKINNLESDYDFLKQQLETKQNKNKFGLNMLNLNNLNNNNNMNNNNNINNNSNFNNLNNNNVKYVEKNQEADKKLLEENKKLKQLLE